jgi:peptide deformylase
MSDIITFDTDSWRKDIKVPTMSVTPKVSTFKLVSENDPILKEVIPEFNFDNPPVDPNAFASSLVETCIKHEGFGLSANQCGFRHRVFVVGAGEEYVAFYNPKIVSSSGSTKLPEGCLSFKNLYLEVERPETIEVEYQDFTGTHKTAKFSGLTARCFQHELDHLNGVCYTKHVGPVALKMANKRRIKFTHSTD